MTFDEAADLTRTDKGRYTHYYSRWYELNVFPVVKREDPVTILEIGVAGGNSLRMWDLLYPNAKAIYGIDIDPKCKQAEQGKIKVFIGDQSDRNFLADVVNTTGAVDLVIDDGSHQSIDIVVTCGILYPISRCYVIEDIWHEDLLRLTNDISSITTNIRIHPSIHPNRFILFALPL